MAWNGTVTCGYCGDTGHNQRSCKTLENQIKHWEESGDEYWQNKAARFKDRRKSKPRRCGYCGTPGHTIRTCAHFDLCCTELTTEYLNARKIISDRMKINNFGVGSLVRYKVQTRNGDNWEYLPRLGVVTDISFDEITRDDLSNRAGFMHKKCVMINNLSARQTRIRLPRCLIDVGKPESKYGIEDYNRFINRVELVNGENVQIPSDFLDSDKIKKQVFHLLRQK